MPLPRRDLGAPQTSNHDVCATREPPVIPVEAGIQSVDSAFPKVCGVDSRFRGNDCGLEHPFLANDTATQF
jgi:hypothetical protein